MEESRNPSTMSDQELQRKSPMDSVSTRKRVKDFYLGECLVIVDPASGKTVLVREVTGNDRQKLGTLALLTGQMRMMAHPNLLPLSDYSFSKQSSFCSTTYVLRQYFEQPATTLREEVKRRTAISAPFSASQLTVMMFHLLSACRFLEDSGYSHGSIHPSVVGLSAEPLVAKLRFFFEEKLTPRGFMEALRRKYLAKQENFPTPSAHRALMQNDRAFLPDLATEDSFALGLTLLEAGTGLPSVRFYLPKGEFDQPKLLASLVQFRKRYEANSAILTNCVAFLLNPKPNTRFSFADVLSRLPPFEDVLSFIQKQKTAPVVSRPPSAIVNSAPRFPPVNVSAVAPSQAVSAQPRPPLSQPSSANSKQPPTPILGQNISAFSLHSIASDKVADEQAANFWGEIMRSAKSPAPSQASSAWPEPEEKNPSKRNIFDDFKLPNAKALKNFFFPEKKESEPAQKFETPAASEPQSTRLSQPPLHPPLSSPTSHTKRFSQFTPASYPSSNPEPQIYASSRTNPQVYFSPSVDKSLRLRGLENQPTLSPVRVYQPNHFTPQRFRSPSPIPQYPSTLSVNISQPLFSAPSSIPLQSIPMVTRGFSEHITLPPVRVQTPQTYISPFYQPEAKPLTPTKIDIIETHHVIEEPMEKKSLPAPLKGLRLIDQYKDPIFATDTPNFEV